MLLDTSNTSSHAEPLWANLLMANAHEWRDRVVQQPIDQLLVVHVVLGDVAGQLHQELRLLELQRAVRQRRHRDRLFGIGVGRRSAKSEKVQAPPTSG